MSKILFWKQFTTWKTPTSKRWILLLICQRYYSESNSQLCRIRETRPWNCCWYVKDTILKAIHNYWLAVWERLRIVADMSKILFWKQFTTSWLWFNKGRWLLLICQRYYSESNSQRNISAILYLLNCCWYVKDTILKAIHNND